MPETGNRAANLATPASLRVLSTLEHAGYEAWFVGGCVRDALLGRSGNDIDIATNAHWQQVQQVCEAQGMATHETGVKHGTITVVCDGEPFEVTTFRTEGTYSDARHPDSVEFVNTIDEDLARRDFTINAMAYHPTRGLHDPYGGQEDLQARMIRAVGDPDERFREDALRILRGVRFASQLGFSIEKATLAGMNQASALLADIAAERIRIEFEGIICGPYAHDALTLYDKPVDAVVPELSAMRGFDQQSRYHIYDVMEHTAFVVEYAKPAEPLLRWAALLHDIGKPEAFFVDPDGFGHFYGHEAISERMAKPICERMKIPPAMIEKILVLVRYHDTYVVPEPRPVKRFLRKIGGSVDLLRTLCALKRADAQAHAPEYRQGVQKADALEACLDDIIRNEEAFRVKDLEISGHDVLACGVKPGPRVGEVLETALEAVIDGKVENEREQLLKFLGL